MGAGDKMLFILLSLDSYSLDSSELNLIMINDFRIWKKGLGLRHAQLVRCRNVYHNRS